jgi:glyceraldehyde 3-phosphate dehydrogenase
VARESADFCPTTNVDRTIVYVNHRDLTPMDRMVSNGSCTANCLAPLVKTLNDAVALNTRHYDDDPQLY